MTSTKYILCSDDVQVIARISNEIVYFVYKMSGYWLVTATILLAGASGGIGAALLERLLRDTRVGHVFATGRGEACSTDAHVTWLELDYTNPYSVSAVGEQLRTQSHKLDRFLCATGSLEGSGRPEKAVAQLDLSRMEASYVVNAAGPLALFAQCAPLLRRSKQPVALFLSAQIGSIEDNKLGGWFSYRMAKAALNMGVKAAAIEAGRWPNSAAVVSVHPGTTLTKLSKRYVAKRQVAPRSAAQTAECIYQLLDTLGPEQNGSFLTATGARLPW